MSIGRCGWGWESWGDDWPPPLVGGLEWIRSSSLSATFQQGLAGGGGWGRARAGGRGGAGTGGGAGGVGAGKGGGGGAGGGGEGVAKDWRDRPGSTRLRPCCRADTRGTGRPRSC